MDKAKQLTGVFAFIILSSFSKYAYAGDGTSFDFRNNTSQEYVIHYGSDIWFIEKEWPKNFTKKNPPNVGDIVIRPGETKNLYAEASCCTNKDPGAAANWDVHSRNDPTKISRFRLEIPNGGGNCKARRFLVDGQYRKIELAPIPIGFPPSTTPTPHFRFTIRDQGNSVVFDQEGPQAKRF
jgi:hypothetical protein